MINSIIQGDCLEVMKTLPDNSIDLILTDPPYFKVKAEWWDRQWSDADKFLAWIDQLSEQWSRILKPNGSIYCFASPQMSARVEVTIGRRFNVLNNIRWDKTNLPGGGRHSASCKEELRSYFRTHETIIFAEHFGADNSAKGEAGYEQKCDELRGFVFEPLRAYLDNERAKAGVKPAQIMEWFESKGFPKYVTARHSFSKSQWELPTSENYQRLQSCFADITKQPGVYLREQYESLREQYESLREQYESLREQYESLRRPFNVTAAVPYTDTWTYPTVQSYKGKHPCEKPAQMLTDIINASSKPGSFVLDCFAGSGSTLVAAQKLDRQFIGIEIDSHWIDVINKRLYPEPVAA